MGWPWFRHSTRREAACTWARWPRLPSGEPGLGGSPPTARDALGFRWTETCSESSSCSRSTQEHRHPAEPQRFPSASRPAGDHVDGCQCWEPPVAVVPSPSTFSSTAATIPSSTIPPRLQRSSLHSCAASWPQRLRDATQGTMSSGSVNRCSASSGASSDGRPASREAPPRLPLLRPLTGGYTEASPMARRRPNSNTKVVPARGLEPRTIGLKDRCSNQAELRRRI